MAVHLDDFQIILGMEFLNAARALAILFYTIKKIKGKKMKFPSGEHGRGEDGDHLGATIPA